MRKPVVDVPRQNVAVENEVRCQLSHWSGNRATCRLRHATTPTAVRLAKEVDDLQRQLAGVQPRSGRRAQMWLSQAQMWLVTNQARTSPQSHWDD